MIDAILSYHLYPLTCGVAKFNQQLADRLGVPHLNVASPGKSQYPLLSVKVSEWPPWKVSEWPPWTDFDAPVYDLLLHEWRGDPREVTWVNEATRVFAANQVIADAVRVYRSDVTTIWCPSTVRGICSREELNVLCFGMAHKLQADLFRRLRLLLHDSGLAYTVSLSTVVHEGHPFDDTFEAAVGQMREIFGDHLRVLGFLADDELVRQFREVSACALFYDPAVRANNTTLWAALSYAVPVVTNLDAQSPAGLYHWNHVFDVTRLLRWPSRTELCGVGSQGQVLARDRYSWDCLMDVFQQTPVHV